MIFFTLMKYFKINNKKNKIKKNKIKNKIKKNKMNKIKNNCKFKN